MSKRFTKQFAARIPRGTLVLCAGALTLWMSGCTTDEEAIVSSSPASVAGTPVQSFTKPTVPAKEAKPSNKVAGLLQSTDPAERARQVQRGIGNTGKDPFSSVPPIVTFKVPVAPLEGQGTGSSAPSSPAQVGNRPVVDKRPSQPKLPSIPTAALPKLIEKSPIAALPPIPDPTLAKAVQVTGVIVVGNTPQAIVQAPNEATSRYVQVGQRISNGQVLVKRIEMNNGSDPIVIFEQNGVEVARTVGSPATPTTPDTKPTAMILQSNFFG
ncbi:MAG TPA: hypothetical protein VL134_01505 [Leptolyngbya sp.]|nr:hypothetical protein [Leptolyngbya sp.]